MEKTNGERRFVDVNGNSGLIDGRFPATGSGNPGEHWRMPIVDGGSVVLDVIFDGGLTVNGPKDTPCEPMSYKTYCLSEGKLELHGRRISIQSTDGGYSSRVLLDDARFEGHDLTRAVLVSARDYQRLADQSLWSAILIPEPSAFRLGAFSCGRRFCWGVGRNGEVARFSRSRREWVVVGRISAGDVVDREEIGGEESGFLFVRRCGRLLLISM